MIGGSFVRGVSGGERKRVSIGNEIIINPSLLFLDEPTSGLDSTTALRTVQMLHDIAEVIYIDVLKQFHQPELWRNHYFLSSTFSKSDLLDAQIHAEIE